MTPAHVTYRPAFQQHGEGGMVAEWCQWPPEVIWYAWPQNENNRPHAEA